MALSLQNNNMVLDYHWQFHALNMVSMPNPMQNFMAYLDIHMIVIWSVSKTTLSNNRGMGYQEDKNFSRHLTD